MQESNGNSLLTSNQPAPPSSKLACYLRNLGRISYSDGLALQHELHDCCAQHEFTGILLLLEHNPVLTCGVKTGDGNILVPKQILDAEGVELFETDRGGDVTYHGPGQLVGYPIMRIRELGLDVHTYLRRLEQSIIDTLAEYGLEGRRNGLAGVWVGEKKLCSIGIAVRKWVTYHGFALNINPNLHHFHLINPCGLMASQISSMAELLGSVPDLEEVRGKYARNFARNFEVDLETWKEKGSG